jgi:hypothetical protein
MWFDTRWRSERAVGKQIWTESGQVQTVRVRRRLEVAAAHERAAGGTLVAACSCLVRGSGARMQWGRD